MRARGATTLLLTALASHGCGQPVVPLETYESPLITLNGYLDPEPANGFGSLRVGILWVDPAELRDDVPGPADGVSFTNDGTDHFALDLFSPPPASVVRRYPGETPDVVGLDFAFGEIIVYEDNDGDGTFSVTSRAAGSAMVAPDLFRGSSPSLALLYLAQPGSPQAGAVGASWPVLFDNGTGYRLALIDCTTPDQPAVRAYDDAMPVEMTIASHGAPHIIFSRDCLRSSPTTTEPP
jgi:hypothetical protein